MIVLVLLAGALWRAGIGGPVVPSDGSRDVWLLGVIAFCVAVDATYILRRTWSMAR